MRINELAKKYDVEKRTLDYWTVRGFIRCTEQANGYRDYNHDSEEDLKKILIIEAMGGRPIDDYLKLIDSIPTEIKDSVKELLFNKILTEKERVNKKFEEAIGYLSEL